MIADNVQPKKQTKEEALTALSAAIATRSELVKRNEDAQTALEKTKSLLETARKVEQEARAKFERTLVEEASGK